MKDHIGNLGNKETMAVNIRRYLSQLGMTQAELAKKIDVPSSTVNCWCKAIAYPRIDKIERMADLFGCLKSDLVEDESSVTHTYELTNEEYAVLLSYRNASEETKRTVMMILMALNGQAGKLGQYIDMVKGSEVK